MPLPHVTTESALAPPADASCVAAPAALWESRRVALSLLALVTVFIAVRATGYVSPFTPLGDDASSHITTIARLTMALRDGEGWWSPDYNLGFPMGLYYQPLPHIASAIVCLALGGPEQASVTYKLLSVGMLLLQPWAIYFGLRRAGFRRSEAALAGALAPAVLKGIEFGYHAQASLQIGLYTQNWGNVALPLAFGELAALCRGRGSLRGAAVAAALTASTHMFFAIALVPPVAALALVSGAPVRAFGRLSIAGIGAFCLLAPWLIPLSLTQAYFGGWPFGAEHRVQGYGFPALWAMFRGGEVMDAHRAPVLLALSIAGVAAGAARWRSPDARRSMGAVLVVLTWSVLGAAGRAGLGEAIDWYPLHKDIQLFRYGALLQFTLLILAGVGAAEIAVQLTDTVGDVVRRVSRVPVSAALSGRARVFAFGAGALGTGAILASPFVGADAQLRSAFRTIDDAGAFREAEYQAAVDFVRSLPDEGGRILISKRTGLRGHYHSGLFAWKVGRPAGQSYGVGLHDSLNFYTLEYFHPDEPQAAVLADLYDFRYVIADGEADISGLDVEEWLYDAGGYRVGRLRVSGEAVTLMREEPAVRGTPRGVRAQIRNWFSGNGPALRRAPTLEVDDPRSREDLTGYPRGAAQPMRYEGTSAPPGAVAESWSRAGQFGARVDLTEAALVVAKVGFHPFWTVQVDGAPAELVFTFPGLVSARVGPGSHEVRGAYRWPWYSQALLLLGLFPLAGFGTLEKRLQGTWLGRLGVP